MHELVFLPLALKFNENYIFLTLTQGKCNTHQLCWGEKEMETATYLKAQTGLVQGEEWMIKSSYNAGRCTF